MRDSRHGTYGVLAIVLSVGLRAAALAQIGEAVHAGLALVAAHAASRAVLPVAMSGTAAGARRWARRHGRAAPRAGAVVTAVGDCRRDRVGVARAAARRGRARARGVRRFRRRRQLARRQIGGYTGDVLGAFQQIAETVMLARGGGEMSETRNPLLVGAPCAGARMAGASTVSSICRATARKLRCSPGSPSNCPASGLGDEQSAPHPRDGRGDHPAGLPGPAGDPRTRRHS